MHFSSLSMKHMFKVMIKHLEVLLDITLLWDLDTHLDNHTVEV